MWGFFFRDISCLVPDNIFGFILNKPSDYKWGILHLPFRRKHWISCRQIGRDYYNLDSKLDSPEVIGDAGLLLKYLRTELADGDKELLLVVNKDIAASGVWKHSQEAEKIENGDLNIMQKEKNKDTILSNEDRKQYNTSVPQSTVDK
jgi:josephin